MRLLCPSDLARSRPLRIVDDEASLSSRLGGRPPVGVRPERITSTTTYFATVPLGKEPDAYVSIFLMVDFDDLLDHHGELGSGDPFACVIHEAAPRVAESALSSPLSEHGFMLLEERDDTLRRTSGEQFNRAGIKIGGRPFLKNREPDLESQIEEIYSEGYSQILQVDFPGPDDALVSGDWPFAEGLFHLFAKTNLDPSDFRWLWEG